MKKLLLIIPLLLLASCNYTCMENAKLLKVEYITLDDGLIGEDKIYAILEFDNGLTRTEEVIGGKSDYRIGKYQCINYTIAN